MVTGLVELVGSQIGSSGSNGGSGNTIAKVLDGDFTTFYDAANATGDWVGVDAGAAVTVRRVKFAPRRGDSGAALKLDFENRVIGAKVQASSSATFASDVNDVLTIPAAPPSYHSLNWNEIALTSPLSKQYVRWLGPTSGRCNIAELRFIADAGPSSAKPVQPVIAPWGGRYPTGSVLVTLTSETISPSLQINYTTDGSTPTTGSTLYTAGSPFTLTIGGSGTTLKVLVTEPSLGTPSSDISTAIFSPWGYKPREDWYDDRGIMLDTKNGGFFRGPGGTPLKVNGWYYWIGCSANRYNVVEGFSDGNGLDGVWMYKTRAVPGSANNFLNWTFVGNVLNVPSSTYFLRQHGIFNPATNKYTIVGNCYPSSRMAVATADNIEGPWTWASTGFDPDGFGFQDNDFLQDTNGDLLIVYATSGNTLVKINKLAADCLSTVGTPINVDVTGGRESPVIVRDPITPFDLLIFDADNNYYDSAVGSFFARMTHSATWNGTWPATTNVCGNLTGGNYNGQLSFGLQFPTGILLGTDFWVHSNITDSRQVWMPYQSGAVTQPASWDVSALGYVAATTATSGISRSRMQMAM